MSKSVNMLGFGQLVSGGGSGGKTVTEAELNSRIRYLEHTISSLADEVKFIKHDRGPRGKRGKQGMDGRNAYMNNMYKYLSYKYIYYILYIWFL